MPVASLLDHFRALDDPRVERTRRHALLDIVAITICGVVCGAETWVDIEAFGRAKEPWLRGFLALPNGIPSHDTFGRVFAALDPEQFEAGFRSWVAAVADLANGAGVAIDGKVLRRSHDRAAGKGALALVGAWAGASRLALGQVPVPAGANEIVAIPELLRLLALEGCVVTTDAIGCQTAVAAAVAARGADCVPALKGNQPALHEAVRLLCAEGRAAGFAGLAHDRHRTVEKGHGRLEVRGAWAVDDPEVIAYLDPAGAWPGPTPWPRSGWRCSTAAGTNRSRPRPGPDNTCAHPPCHSGQSRVAHGRWVAPRDDRQAPVVVSPAQCGCPAAPSPERRAVLCSSATGGRGAALLAPATTSSG